MMNQSALGLFFNVDQPEIQNHRSHHQVLFAPADRPLSAAPRMVAGTSLCAFDPLRSEEWANLSNNPGSRSFWLADRGNDRRVGMGERSDWYRNLAAHPALEVQIGRRRFTPKQRFLNQDEAYQEIVDDERHHPIAIRGLAPLFGYRYDGSEQSRRAFADSLRMVSFHP